MKKTGKTSREVSFGSELNKAFLTDHEYVEVEKIKKARVNDTNTNQINQVKPDQITQNPIDPSKTIRSKDQIIITRGFQTFLFDPVSYEFIRVADNQRDRSYFSTVYTNGKLYAISTFSKTAAGTTECYDPIVNKWQTTPALPRRLRSIGAVKSVASGSVLVTGGIDLDSMEKSDSVFELVYKDSSSDELTWEEKPSKLLAPRYRHAAATAPDGKIWIAGGIVSVSQLRADIFTASTEVFDPVTNTWSSGPAMCVQRAIDLHLLFVDDVLYAVGGDVMMPRFDSPGVPETTIERLNPTNNTWELVASFPKERHGISVAAVGSTIFVFGGEVVRQGDVSLSLWDAYDIRTNAWLSADNAQRLVPFDCQYGSACLLSNLDSV